MIRDLFARYIGRRALIFDPPGAAAAEYRAKLEQLSTFPAVADLLARARPHPELIDPPDDFCDPQIIVFNDRLRRRPDATVAELRWCNAVAVCWFEGPDLLVELDAETVDEDGLFYVDI